MKIFIIFTLTKHRPFYYNIFMEFKLKQLSNSLQVTKIANVHFFEFEESKQTQKDKHPFCELLFSYSGVLKIEGDNFKGKLKKDEMIIHGANELHSLATHKNKKTTIVILGFECNSPLLKFFSENKIRLDEREKKQIARIIKEGRNVFAPPYDKVLYDMKKKENQIFGSEQLLRSLLEIFLIELIRKHVLAKHEEYDGEVKRFDEVITYVDAHFMEKITLDELAFLFSTNRSAFCKDFKAHTGQTFVNYVAIKKTDKIKELLIKSDKSIAEISSQLGFESSAYFCRFFKKQTDLTPKEYRKQYK